MVVGHTNEAEYRHFLANPRNEALRSRLFVIPVPYNLRVSAEVKIYEKMVGAATLRVHLAPHALWTAAVFSVLSRLKEPRKQGFDLVKKMRLYDGEEVEGATPRDVDELRAEAGLEGMSGVDPRFVLDRLSSAMVAKEGKCVNAWDVLRALREGLVQHPGLAAEERERLLGLLMLAHREYNRVAGEDLRQALLRAYEGAARNLFAKYLDNVQAYCRGCRVEDPFTGQAREPDERLMRSLEEQMGVGEAAKKAFREEIFFQLVTFSRRGQPFDYRCHRQLQEAVENKLLDDLRPTFRLTAGLPFAAGEGEMAAAVRWLMEERGYCRECAGQLLAHAEGLLDSQARVDAYAGRPGQP